MNDYHRDNAYQRNKRDEFLVPFYEYWWSGLYMLHDNDPVYQKRGIDTSISMIKATTHIEEKIVRNVHTAFTLETRSCTIPGYESPGWMFYSEADRLLYCFPLDDGLDCWWIDLPALQKWFWPKEAEFKLWKNATKNRSWVRIVSIKAIQDAGIFISNFKVTSEWRSMWQKPFHRPKLL